MNQELLDVYSSCNTSEDVVRAQNDYLEKAQQEAELNRSKDNFIIFLKNCNKVVVYGFIKEILKMLHCMGIYPA